MEHEFRLQLDVPEHGQLALPLAGIGTRALAAAIDMGIVALGLLVVAIVLFGGAVTGMMSGDLGLPLAIAAVAIVPILGPLLCELLMHGQSPGKRWLQLRVISHDGAPAAPAQLLLRNVLRLVDLLPMGYLVGLVAVFVSARTQRLGDMAAGTIVIREHPLAMQSAEAPGVLVPKDLYGVPASVLQAAQILADPSRQLAEAVATQRRAELASVVRAHRPDLAAVSDAELWARLLAAIDS